MNIPLTITLPLSLVNSLNTLLEKELTDYQEQQELSDPMMTHKKQLAAWEKDDDAYREKYSGKYTSKPKPVFSRKLKLKVKKLGRKPTVSTVVEKLLTECFETTNKKG